jgi:hypothetical protein
MSRIRYFHPSGMGSSFGTVVPYTSLRCHSPSIASSDSIFMHITGHAAIGVIASIITAPRCSIQHEIRRLPCLGLSPGLSLFLSGLPPPPRHATVSPSLPAGRVEEAPTPLPIHSPTARATSLSATTVSRRNRTQIWTASARLTSSRPAGSTSTTYRPCQGFQTSIQSARLRWSSSQRA